MSGPELCRVSALAVGGTQPINDRRLDSPHAGLLVFVAFGLDPPIQLWVARAAFRP